MESFFARLKTECYYGNRFETFEQLEKAIVNIFITIIMNGFKQN
ncbi:IS3 family transposase [Rodentibacter rarus]